jgi:hypothetical protein
MSKKSVHSIKADYKPPVLKEEKLSVMPKKIKIKKKFGNVKTPNPFHQ